MSVSMTLTEPSDDACVFVSSFAKSLTCSALQPSLSTAASGTVSGHKSSPFMTPSLSRSGLFGSTVLLVLLVSFCVWFVLLAEISGTLGSVPVTYSSMLVHPYKSASISASEIPPDMVRWVRLNPCLISHQSGMPSASLSVVSSVRFQSSHHEMRYGSVMSSEWMRKPISRFFKIELSPQLIDEMRTLSPSMIAPLLWTFST